MEFLESSIYYIQSYIVTKLITAKAEHKNNGIVE